MLGSEASAELLDALRGLHWPARRNARGTSAGGHRSRRLGSSPEFVQYREYRPGDELSKVDWKLFGRTERVAIRQTRDDSDLRTTILVDASASMAFPERDLGKWRSAASIAFGLSAVTQSDRDAVGVAIVSGEGVEVLPPRTRAGTPANILRLLGGTTPAGARPLAPALAMLRTSGRVAIVSDFLGDADALVAMASEMVIAGHEIYAIHVVAREEIDPQMLGSIVIDPEEVTLRRPFDEDGVAEYRRTFDAWRESLAEKWKAAGAYYELAVIDEPVEQLIRRVVTPAEASAATHAPA